MSDVWFQGLIQVLSLLGPTQALGGIAAVVLEQWQSEQAKKLEVRLEYKIKKVTSQLDKRKLDSNFVQSDEFKSLIIQILNVNAETSSELKREALANAIVNTAYPWGTQLPGKQMLVRVLAQMSDEEIQVLTVYQRHREALEERSDTPAAVTDEGISRVLRWPLADARATCEGLVQLGLLYDPYIGFTDYKRGSWCMTELAKRMVDWCISEKPADEAPPPPKIFVPNEIVDD